MARVIIHKGKKYRELSIDFKVTIIFTKTDIGLWQAVVKEARKEK